MRIDRLADGKSERAQLAPRLSLGATMIYHGGSKLRPGAVEQAGGMFEQLGIRPGKRWALATGLAELGAGVLTLLGIGTRLAGLAVLVTQAVAVRKVHLQKGFDVQKGGFEFNLALMAMAAGLLLAGPGRPSLSHVARRRLYRRRPWTALPGRSNGHKALAFLQ